MRRFPILLITAAIFAAFGVSDASATRVNCSMTALDPQCYTAIAQTLGQAQDKWIAFTGGEYGGLPSEYVIASHTDEAYNITFDTTSAGGEFDALYTEGELPSLDRLLNMNGALDIAEIAGGEAFVAKIAIAAAWGVYQYGVDWAWANWVNEGTIPQLARQGDPNGPEWVFYPNMCANESNPDSPTGFGFGPGYVFEWGATDASWTNQFGDGQYADENTGCGIPNPDMYSGQVKTDLSAIRDATNTAELAYDPTGAGSNACQNFQGNDVGEFIPGGQMPHVEHSGYGGVGFGGLFPFYNGNELTGTNDSLPEFLKGYSAYGLPVRGAEDMLACAITGIGDAPVTPDFTFNVTVPQSQQAVPYDTPSENAINKALQDNGDVTSGENQPPPTGCSCADPPPISSFSPSLHSLTFGGSQTVDYSPLTSISATDVFPFGIWPWVNDNFIGQFSGGDYFHAGSPVTFTLPLFGEDKTISLQSDTWENTWRTPVFLLLDFLTVVGGVILFSLRIIGYNRSGEGGEE